MKKFPREIVGTADAIVILAAVVAGDYHQALVQVRPDPDLLKAEIKGRNE